MNNSHQMKGVILGIAVMLLAACTAAPVPEDHFYRLEPVETGKLFPQPPIDGVLKVMRVDGFGIFRERAILVSDAASPQGVDRHHYHHWIDAPPQLVRDHFVRYLRATGVAGLVAGDHVSQPSNVRLQLVLKDFTRLLNAGGVEVSVALDVVATRSGIAGPVLIQHYQVKVPANDNSMPASVEAFRQALAALYGQITTDLVAALDS